MASMSVSAAPRGLTKDMLQKLNAEITFNNTIKQFREGSRDITHPAALEQLLGSHGVRELVERISNDLNRKVMAFYDHADKAFHIMFPPMLNQDSSAVNEPYAAASKPTSEMTQQQVLFPQVAFPPVVLTGKETIKAVQPNTGGARNNQGHRRGARPTRVPRPMNSFILYRKDMHPRYAAAHPELRNTDISKLIGKAWKNESPAVKQHYKDLADQKAAEFAQNNPGYRYEPRKSGQIKRRAKKGKGFEVSDAPVEFVDPHVIEQIISTRQAARMAGGLLVNSNNITAAEPQVGIPLEMGVRPYVNMSSVSLADQVAHSHVLDEAELVAQASDNLTFEEKIARNLASALNSLQENNATSGFTSFGAAVPAEHDYDNFTAATLRNAGLTAEGALEPFDNFNFPDHGFNFDFSAIDGTASDNLTL